jgi:hypothetical protein
VGLTAIWSALLEIKMQFEGRGIVAPAPVRIRIGKAARDFYANATEKINTYRQYDSRSDPWGKGFVKNPMLIGKGGELAMSEFLRRCGLNLNVDVTLRKRGDGGHDFNVLGDRYEIKTRSKTRSNFVRYIDNVVPSNYCDLFVFAQWCADPPDEYALLLGWIWSVDVGRMPIELAPAKGSNHSNYVIQDSDLKTMSRLRDRIKALKFRRSREIA